MVPWGGKKDKEHYFRFVNGTEYKDHRKEVQYVSDAKSITSRIRLSVWKPHLTKDLVR